MYYSYGNLIESGNHPNLKGFYVTVWEKQNRSWKIVADVVQFTKLEFNVRKGQVFIYELMQSVVKKVNLLFLIV